MPLKYMKAAWWGTTVGYSDLGNRVEIENEGNVITYVSKDTFDYLYFKLDEHTAALKENCIDYAVYSEDNPVCYYPDWFVDAVHQGAIFLEDDISTFWDGSNGIVLNHGSVVVRNFMGQMKHMERDNFDRYYVALEE